MGSANSTSGFGLHAGVDASQEITQRSTRAGHHLVAPVFQSNVKGRVIVVFFVFGNFILAVVFTAFAMLAAAMVAMVTAMATLSTLAALAAFFAAVMAIIGVGRASAQAARAEDGGYAHQAEYFQDLTPVDMFEEFFIMDGDEQRFPCGVHDTPPTRLTAGVLYYLSAFANSKPAIHCDHH